MGAASQHHHPCHHLPARGPGDDVCPHRGHGLPLPLRPGVRRRCRLGHRADISRRELPQTYPRNGRGHRPIHDRHRPTAGLHHERRHQRRPRGAADHGAAQWQCRSARHHPGPTFLGRGSRPADLQGWPTRRDGLPCLPRQPRHLLGQRCGVAMDAPPVLHPSHRPVDRHPPHARVGPLVPVQGTPHRRHRGAEARSGRGQGRPHPGRDRGDARRPASREAGCPPGACPGTCVAHTVAAQAAVRRHLPGHRQPDHRRQHRHVLRPQGTGVRRDDDLGLHHRPGGQRRHVGHRGSSRAVARLPIQPSQPAHLRRDGGGGHPAGHCRDLSPRHRLAHRRRDDATALGAVPGARAHGGVHARRPVDQWHRRVDHAR